MVYQPKNAITPACRTGRQKRNNPITNKWLSVLLLVVFSVLFATVACADEKVWSAGGDETTWSDDDNWFPAVEPNSEDDVTIDMEDASVTCTETFKAKSIVVGGRTSSTLTSNNFVYGTVTPDSASDVALDNKKGGTIILKGAGTLTLGGQYRSSEESLISEPSFMFWVK